MLRLLHTLLVAAAALGAHAGGFGLRWMSCPAPDDSSEVWFRRTFVSDGRPRHVSVAVASTGRFVLYVNGRNVSTSLYMPHRAVGDTSAVSVEVDVTRFLRRDSNTVAVLYCPSSASRRQVAVALWGVDAMGDRVASCGVDGWMCRLAPRRLRRTMGLSGCGEVVDGRVTDVPWPMGQVDMALWLPVREGAAVMACRDVPPDGGARVAKVLRPRYFDVLGPRAVAYDFGPGFHGFVRVTLRGCRRGLTLRVGDVWYVCSGEMDEQAYARFTPTFARRVVVSGAPGFSPDQVQDVEAICTDMGTATLHRALQGQKQNCTSYFLHTT